MQITLGHFVGIVIKGKTKIRCIGLRIQNVPTVVINAFLIRKAHMDKKYKNGGKYAS